MSEEFDLRFKISLDNKDGLADFFRQSERGAEHLEASFAKMLGTAGATMSAIASKAKSEMNDFAGKELGGSIASNARGVLKYRDAVTQLAVSAGKGTEAVAGLNALIQKTSKDTNQLQGDVTDAMAAFVERSGDLPTAIKNIEQYGKVATATGASLREVALVGESLSSKLGITDQSTAFAILVAQAKKGAIELRDIAKYGGTVFTAAGAANVPKNESGVSQIGGLLQTVAGGSRGQGKTSAADTAVMVQALFANIRQKAGKIEELGIKVDGRNYIDVARDLVKHFNGEGQGLGAIFKNERAFRAIAVLAEQYKDDKRISPRRSGFTRLDELTNLDANPAFIAEDFATRRKTGDAKLKAAEISKNAFYEKWGGGLAEFGAEHGMELQLATMAAGLSGKGLSMASRFLTKGAGAGGGLGGVLSDLTAAPVRVVNWPAGFGGGAPGTPTSKEDGMFVSAAKAAWTYGKYAIPIAGAVALGTAAVAYAGDREDMVKQLTEGTQKKDAAAKARHDSIKLRSDGGIIAAPGQSLGNLDEVMKQEITTKVEVTVTDKEITVADDSGTRSPKVIPRRGGGGRN